jgi:hypothetical protein
MFPNLTSYLFPNSTPAEWQRGLDERILSYTPAQRREDMLEYIIRPFAAPLYIPEVRYTCYAWIIMYLSTFFF